VKSLIIPVFALLAISAKDCPKPPNPVPTPTPTSTPTPLPTPTPTPTPIPCSIPDAGSNFITPRPPADSQIVSVLNSTLVSMTTCPPQSRCPIFTDQQTFLKQVVGQLALVGICSGIQTGADEICILESPGKCQGYHIFTCGTDCNRGVVGWAPGSVRDTWVIGQVPPTPIPTPVPTPTPQLNCPPSLDRIVLAVRSQAAFIVDATPQTGNKVWCDANGFAGRNFCPMGAEGSSSRPICEQLFAPYTWTYQNKPCPNDFCFDNNGNNLQEKVRKDSGGGLIVIKALNGVSASATVPK
jgi:hypothetical protein